MPPVFEVGHLEFISILISVMLTVILWFISRTLRKIDANQTELFNRLDTLSKDFYELRGEHRGVLKLGHRAGSGT